ncbi:MAG: metallophosphoesterase, partial [Lentisphaeria bacterium]|nr:metallophosphoesterase [Lentisphaeria bacterium]
MRLAILADSHLPDCSDSAQEATLRWAVAAARAAGADWLVAAGDMTAAGEPVPAERVAAILAAGGVPYVSTPGNAELRDLVVGYSVCRMLTTENAAAPVVTVDTAMGSVPETERQRVEQRLASGSAASVLVTHWPPDELPEGDREWFAGLVARFSP